MELEEQLGRLDPPVKEMLAEDLPAQLEQIRKALETNDLESAREVVHTVHGTASFCKLQHLRHAAATLEQSLLNGQQDKEETRAFTESVHNVLRVLEANHLGAKE